MARYLCAGDSEAVGADVAAVDGFFVAPFLVGAVLALVDFFAMVVGFLIFDEVDLDATVARFAGALLLTATFLVTALSLETRAATAVVASERKRMDCPATTFPLRKPFIALSRATVT